MLKAGQLMLETGSALTGPTGLACGLLKKAGQSALGREAAGLQRGPADTGVPALSANRKRIRSDKCAFCSVRAVRQKALKQARA